MQGYQQHAIDILKENQEEAKISHRAISNGGRDIYILHFDDISSTMLLLQKWNTSLLDDKTSFLFTTKQQSAGRGQRTNTWSSPPGNIYMTILTKQSVDTIPYLHMLSHWATIEVLEENLQLTEKITVKWINDLNIDDKKFGGVLIISNVQGDKSYLQIGIGVNMLVSPLETSTCLSKYIKNKEEINEEKINMLIEKICIKVLKYCSQIDNIKLDLLEKYHERLRFLNEEVKIYDSSLKNVLHVGKFLGLNEYGHARLQIQGGQVLQLTEGRMRRQ